MQSLKDCLTMLVGAVSAVLFMALFAVSVSYAQQILEVAHATAS